MYKIASQKKLRIATSRGNLSVEQLWDLSKDEIADLAVAIRKRIRDDRGTAGDSELDFLKPSGQKEDTVEQLTFRILKDIYQTKKADEDKARSAAEKRLKNRRILELIARKQDQELESKSIEELEAMLEEEE